MREDEMVGWHHWLDGHKFEYAAAVGCWTVKPGMLQSMGWQRVGHNWVTELKWQLPSNAYVDFYKYIIYKILISWCYGNLNLHFCWFLVFFLLLFVCKLVGWFIHYYFLCLCFMTWENCVCTIFRRSWQARDPGELTVCIFSSEDSGN